MRHGSSQISAFRQLFELADRAEAWGIDCVWLGENHFAPVRSVISASLHHQRRPRPEAETSRYAHWLRQLRAVCTEGFGYWSLAGYVKWKVKRAVMFIGDFENAVAREAARRGMAGVVCGHIHKAELRSVGPVL